VYFYKTRWAVLIPVIYVLSGEFIALVSGTIVGEDPPFPLLCLYFWFGWVVWVFGVLVLCWVGLWCVGWVGCVVLCAGCVGCTDDVGRIHVSSGLQRRLQNEYLDPLLLGPDPDPDGRKCGILDRLVDPIISLRQTDSGIKVVLPRQWRSRLQIEGRVLSAKPVETGCNGRWIPGFGSGLFGSMRAFGI